MKFSGVFEGGGIRGIAYAGAIEVFERDGHEFTAVAGSSAGAITAALLACGCDAHEIMRLVGNTNFRSFMDVPWGLRSWNLFRRGGLFRGAAFEEWMRSIVGDRTIGDAEIPLRIFATDIERRETVVFDSARTPGVRIANAVRASMSIPIVFEPKVIEGRKLVDGGVAYNYPIDTYDHDLAADPVVGFYLHEKEPGPRTVSGPVETALALISAAREASNKRLTDENRYRSVGIPDAGVWWLKFSLDESEIRALIESGRMAAKAFLWEASRRQVSG